MRFFAAALAAAFLWLFMLHSVAQAHVVCGDRVFPTTLTMDDPGVSDEMSLPTITFTPTPDGESNSYGYEWDKTITEDLGFAVNGGYLTQHGPAQNLSGWDNITVTLKDQHPCIQRHAHEELAWSVGVVRLIPGTGSVQLRNGGVIDSVGNTAPTFYFGKGLGDVSGRLPAPYCDHRRSEPRVFRCTECEPECVELRGLVAIFDSLPAAERKGTAHLAVAETHDAARRDCNEHPRRRFTNGNNRARLILRRQYLAVGRRGTHPSEQGHAPRAGHRLHHSVSLVSRRFL